jgi:myo-inositol 2-dehydrogenase / D-chiro-inositol 1-dehydrogenase
MAELEHFADCVEKETQPLAGFSEGRESLRLANAAFESLQTGQVVRLEA